jgi:hypothetical protein
MMTASHSFIGVIIKLALSVYKFFVRTPAAKVKQATANSPNYYRNITDLINLSDTYYTLISSRLLDPPFPGWWATFDTVGQEKKRRILKWRWFNEHGSWSMPASSSLTPEEAGKVAKLKASAGEVSQFGWCHFWPEYARVERVPPENHPQFDY